MDNMKRALMTVLRDRSSSREEFRSAAEKLAMILAAESAEHIASKTIEIETPLGAYTQGAVLNQDIILVPILRSGAVLVRSFLYYYPTATVGMLGMQRDEQTARAETYYEKIPEIRDEHQLFLLDPMVATGGSACDAIEALLEKGAEQEQIIFVGIIGSKDGVTRIRERYPRVTIMTVAIDAQLNAENFIEPGLGDFGDRFMGTE